MRKAGFYIIKDKFFEDMQEPFLKGNKNSNRPHYYCVKDEADGVYWMIPLSSKTEKYKKIIFGLKKANKSYDGLHILRLATGRESVFLIQDIFPVTEQYIEREYTVSGIPFALAKEKEIRVLESKALTVINMLRQGIKFTPTQPNVLAILEKLKDK